MAKEIKKTGEAISIYLQLLWEDLLFKSTTAIVIMVYILKAEWLHSLFGLSLISCKNIPFLALLGHEILCNFSAGPDVFKDSHFFIFLLDFYLFVNYISREISLSTKYFYSCCNNEYKQN